MAAQRYKDILFSYSGLIASASEVKLISDYFDLLKISTAQAYASEIIDLRKYTIQRNPTRIKKILKNKKEQPFIFVNCLN